MTSFYAIMLHREIITVCSEIRRKHINSLRERKKKDSQLVVRVITYMEGGGTDDTSFQNDQERGV